MQNIVRATHSHQLLLMVEQSKHLAILLQLVAQRFDDFCEIGRHEKRNVRACGLAKYPGNSLSSWLRTMKLENLPLITAFPSNGCASGTSVSASTASRTKRGRLVKRSTSCSLW